MTHNVTTKMTRDEVRELLESLRKDSTLTLDEYNSLMRKITTVSWIIANTDAGCRRIQICLILELLK
jgi:hypothetical protein